MTIATGYPILSADVNAALAARLQLAGGTMTGLLTLAQDPVGPLDAVTKEYVDKTTGMVASVLEFGADPTNNLDSTAAFRAAIATGYNVYVPKGLYKISDLLTLQNAQLMYGDGRTQSQLMIYSTLFNMSAIGVVQLAASETAGRLRDIGIVMNQPDTAVRANLYQYPPAIYAQNSGRFQIERVRVTGAIMGLDARGNAGGSYINMLEMAAFSIGMIWDGSLDIVHCDNYHFWNFGTTANQVTIWQDGNTYAAQFGNINGLAATNFFSLIGKVWFFNSTLGSGQGWFDFANMLMDADGSTVQVDNCQWLHVANFYSTKSGIASNPPSWQVNGGIVRVTNFEINHGSIAAPIVVTGGELHLTTGKVSKGANRNGVATVSGGRLHVTNVVCLDGGSGALGTALYTQTSPGILRVIGGAYTGSCSSGAAVSIGADDPLNMVQGFGFGVLGISLPAAILANGPAMARYQYPLVSPLTGGSQFNTAIGAGALGQGVSGATSNTIFGDSAGAAVSTGNSNTLVGQAAGTALTTGTLNTAIGRVALQGITTANACTAIGYGALQSTTGASNTGLGRQAGSGISSGTFNTVIGHQVGFNNIGTGGGNLLIGVNNAVDVPTANQANYFALGGTYGPQFTAVGMNTATPQWAFLGSVAFGAVGAPNITSGAGVPSSTQPNGSIYMRTDGAAGTRLYVSAGAGTWTAVAGV